MRKLAILLAMLLVAATGCIQVPGTVAGLNFSPPLITSFTASPQVITVGETADISWSVTNATNVVITNIGTVGLSGSLTVLPSSTTTYTLTASNSYGSVTASAYITVNPMSAPPVISSFTVDPPVIAPGQTGTLTWNVTGADSVRIDPSVGTVQASGSQTVSPGYTTTYILTASNPAGIVTSSSALSVTPYATYSTGSGYPGYPVYPPYSGTGTLPVILSFDVQPPVIAPGESAVMTWDVMGATSISIEPAIGPVGGVGSIGITPYSTTYYVLTATNDSGSTTASALVSVYALNYYSYPQAPVVVVPPTNSGEGRGERGGGTEGGSQDMDRVPRIEHFNTSPTRIEPGNSAQLNWKVNGATSVHISPDIGSVPSSGTMTVTPSHTTVYTITASNSTGVVQHPEELTVPRTGRMGSENITR